MCLRVDLRMECPECGYPYCEALHELNERVPHTEEKMIGLAWVVIRRGKDKNEFHHVNVWDMALSLPKTEEGKRNFREQIMLLAEKWKPEMVTTDDELRAINRATNCISPEHEGADKYHKHAADIVYLIDLVTDKDGRTNGHKKDLEF